VPKSAQRPPRRGSNGRTRPVVADGAVRRGGQSAASRVLRGRLPGGHLEVVRPGCRSHATPTAIAPATGKRCERECNSRHGQSLPSHFPLALARPATGPCSPQPRRCDPRPGIRRVPTTPRAPRVAAPAGTDRPVALLPTPGRAGSFPVMLRPRRRARQGVVQIVPPGGPGAIPRVRRRFRRRGTS
jgi:hypothetical protein